jgi:FixJ family two-component response regulator
MYPVYLIDDDEPLLRSLTRLLELSGFQVTAFSNGLEFIRDLATLPLGCVITDLKMPGMSGLQLIEHLERSGLSLPVIFLTGQGEIADSVLAMKRGAVNFLTKPVRRQQLLEALEEASARLASNQSEDTKKSDLRTRFNLLTPREKEVFVKITQGLLNKQTAFELGISERTIKCHRARVMEKMQAKSMADLVRMFDTLQTDGPRLTKSTSP